MREMTIDKTKRKKGTYYIRCGASKKEICKYQLGCSGWGKYYEQHKYVA